jgi:hypothetical protein
MSAVTVPTGHDLAIKLGTAHLLVPEIDIPFSHAQNVIGSLLIG